MKRIAETKVPEYQASWKKISQFEEPSAMPDSICRILIDHVHDRKDALYQGGTEVNLTGEGLKRT